jgi:hypothetical protein
MSLRQIERGQANANIVPFKITDFDHEFLPDSATEVGKAVCR